MFPKRKSDEPSRKEAQDLEKAQKESDVAYVEYKKMKDAYTKAQHDGTSEEEVIGFRGKMYDLEEEARTKEQTLRGLQDFCD